MTQREQQSGVASFMKSGSEMQRMREACKTAAKVLRTSAKLVKPGITTKDIDKSVGEIIRGENAESAFLGYRGFPGQCCISVNEEVIHGIGSDRRINFGDLVKLDIGVRKNGFIGDVAMSIAVGGCSPTTQNIIDTTIAALHNGLKVIRNNAEIREVSKAIQETVESGGFSVVREFVGHGVGRNLHEDPQIPNFYQKANRTKLCSGMTIAIEPMVNRGFSHVQIMNDGWTVIASDRLLSAHFEHTVLVTDSGCEILTDDGEGLMY